MAGYTSLPFQYFRPEHIGGHFQPPLDTRLLDAFAVERAATQRQARVERPGDLLVEPRVDAARHELVRHGVDHQPGQHADQRADEDADEAVNQIDRL